jgi:hypothetical protein
MPDIEALRVELRRGRWFRVHGLARAMVGVSSLAMRNDHVSTFVLRSEALGRDACLAAKCRARLLLTFPEDRDGPLLVSDEQTEPA